MRSLSKWLVMCWENLLYIDMDANVCISSTYLYLALTGLLIKPSTPFKQTLPISILCTVHKQTLSLTFVLFNWWNVYMFVYSRLFVLYLHIQIFAALKIMHTTLRIVRRLCMMKLRVERVLISENPSGDFNDERHFSSSWHLLSHV